MREASFNGSIFYFLILPFLLVALLLTSGTLFAHPDSEGGVGHVHDEEEVQSEITATDGDIVFQSIGSIADAISEENYEKVLDFVVQENYQLRQDILSSLQESKIQDYHFNDLDYDISVVEGDELRATIEYIASGPGWKNVGIAVFIFSRVEAGPQNASSPARGTANRWLITRTDFHKKIVYSTVENTLLQLASRLVLFFVIYTPIITITILYTLYKRPTDFALWIVIMLGLPIIGLVLFWGNQMYTAPKQRSSP